MRRSLALGLIAVTGLTGCGSSHHEPIAPDRMLDQAAAHPIHSAQIQAAASLQLHGVERLTTPIRLRADGPYLSGEGRRIPSFDWRVSTGALGFGVGGRLVSTGENVFLSVYGDDYEVGTGAVAAANDWIRGASQPPEPLEAEVRDWFGRARIEGQGTEGGTDCERIAAPLRAVPLTGDIAGPLGALGLASPPTVHGTVRACVGFDDRTFHQLRLEAKLGFPPEDQARLGGATGADLNADVVFSDIGETQRISAPKGSHRPIRDLFLSLNDLGVPIPL
jgi:hypothetical protein